MAIGKRYAEKQNRVLFRSLLSFAPAGTFRFAADKYHKIFHFGPHHLKLLSGKDVLWSPDPKQWRPHLAAEGVVAFFPNGLLYNPPTWQSTRPEEFYSFRQYVLVGDCMELTEVHKNTYLTPDKQTIVFAENKDSDGSKTIRMRGENLGKLEEHFLYPYLVIGNVESYALIRKSSQEYEVSLLAALSYNKKLQIRGYRILKTYSYRSLFSD
jgi:hypothetical protein